MSGFQQTPVDLNQFSGQIRVFPLPNLVLFPHVLQPLHIFEPRYRDLLEDAIEGDRLIAMATLAPGWQRDYEGRPNLYPMACVGQITTYRRLPDGTYNLLLAGLQRAKLETELPPTRSFRVARVSLCGETFPPSDLPSLVALRDELRATFLALLPQVADAHEQVAHLLKADMPLGMITDLIGYMLDLGLREKMALLEELDVDRRARLLLGYLQSALEETGPATGHREFPPPFSVN